MSRRRVYLGLVGIVIAVLVMMLPPAQRIWWPVLTHLRGRATVEDRIQVFGDAARLRLRPHFERADVTYPPRRLTLVAFKQERELHIYAAAADEPLRFIHRYSVQGASGTLGPKLREGDRQVPEGLYRIESLNPNSRYHVSLRVDYPNAFDRSMAARDGRDRLGGDIFLHGGSASIGCLAMGDPVAEELFVLAAETGLQSIEVILTPFDIRRDEVMLDRSGWRGELYDQIAAALASLPLPPLQ